VKTLRVSPLRVPSADALPSYMQSLLRAAKSGGDIFPEVASLVAKLGFDSLTYWAATRSTSIVEGRLYEFSTLEAEWTSRYDEMGYVEIDPRIKLGATKTVPVVWDQPMLRSCFPHIDGFLEDASAVGIGSGVCVPIHDHSFGIARFDFTVTAQQLGPARWSAIESALGELMIVARFLHDLFVAAIRRGEIDARAAGLPLSAREVACLALAMRGYPATQIANDLRIEVRGVNTHFDSIRSKLGCLNRDEAIASAIKAGLLTP
jgi:DNA-binding CsgD family transcriptional regulator